jgi:hypothetical protein
MRNDCRKHWEDAARRLGKDANGYNSICARMLREL